MKTEINRHINTFVSLLEKKLNTVLKREEMSQATVFHSKSPLFSIAIYGPVSGGRLTGFSHKTYHIDADYLLLHQNKILQRLYSLFGKGKTIYARQTVVARIDKRATADFLEEHHLNAPLTGKYRYGLYHQGELVSIAVFSGGRHMRDQPSDYRSFELLRFCHKSGYRVVGGISKLIRAFAVDFQPNDIMTYVDRDWSQDSSLQTLGFETLGITGVQQYWIMGDQRTPVRNERDLENIQHEQPFGYLRSNAGSTKLLLRF
ncbi:hypothetical protein [Sphingobacterium suaedae]|uniref:Uncharacterized protein n=1 Tax=Sphingobacterium suaedae TaxID=1686402 RepID=A0ABW5KCK7_9SPHI